MEPIDSLGRVIVEFTDGSDLKLWDGYFHCSNCGHDWESLVRLHQGKGPVECPSCGTKYELVPSEVEAA
jgi:putative FmdB family regulatory protein